MSPYFVALAACILVACGATRPTETPAAPRGSDAPPSEEFGARIARIEHGLLPPVEVVGETIPWSIEERMRVHRVPGLVIAVIDDYRVVWTKAYGVADASTGERMRETTLLQAGSISKSVAAMMALIEVERGKLALDANINGSLKSWKLPDNDFTRQTPVTLRHLLSHTGGTTAPGYIGYAADDAVPTLREVLDGTASAAGEPVFVKRAPGLEFRYSGGGTLVAQQAVIDANGGRPFPAIAVERVLGPLGMTHSTFELSPERAKEAAAGHIVGKIIWGKRHTYPEMAAGGLWTTPEDLARFLVEIQRTLAGRGTHVSPQIAKWMTTSVTRAGNLGEVSLGTFLSKRSVEAEYFGHDGTNEGFQATAVARKGKGYGAVVMANSVGSDPLLAEVRAAIAREYAWDGYPPVRIERRKVDASRLAPLAGRWALGPDRAFVLSVGNGRLELRRPMEDPEELVPIGDDVFVNVLRGERWSFTHREGRDEMVITRDEGQPESAFRLGNDAVVPSFLIEAGREGEAVVAYRKLLATAREDPDDMDARLSRMARKLFRGRHEAAALRVLRVAAALFPSDTWRLEELGDTYALSDERARAAEAYKAAIALMNRDPKASPKDKSVYAARIGNKIRHLETP